MNSGAYWYLGAWNEGTYAIGVVVILGALINKNTFEVGALIREWALIGMKFVDAQNNCFLEGQVFYMNANNTYNSDDAKHNTNFYASFMVF